MFSIYNMMRCDALQNISIVENRAAGYRMITCGAINDDNICIMTTLVFAVYMPLHIQNKTTHYKRTQNTTQYIWYHVQ